MEIQSKLQVNFIDVRDGMPESGDPCLVVTSAYKYHVAYFDPDPKLGSYWADLATEDVLEGAVQGWMPLAGLYEARNRMIDVREARQKAICEGITEKTQFKDLLALAHDPTLYSIEHFAKALSEDQRDRLLERLRSEVRDRQFEVEAFEQVIYGRENVEKSRAATFGEVVRGGERMQRAMASDSDVRDLVEDDRQARLREMAKAED